MAVHLIQPRDSSDTFTQKLFLSAQSLLQLQVDASEGFKQQAAFCHKLHDCLPCNKLLASSHALGRFTCCAHQKQYQFKQILIFDLVKQIFLMQK